MRFLQFLLFLFPALLFSVDMNETLVSDYNATLNANNLGMAYNDYNFLMGLSGLLVGFVFMYGIIYLIMNIARGR